MVAVDECEHTVPCPRLAAGYRLQFEPAQQCWVLLYPEGMVTLNAGAAEILQRVDGARTVAGIVEDLQRAFPGVDLEADVHEFLAVAGERGWLLDAPPVNPGDSA